MIQYNFLWSHIYILVAYVSRINWKLEWLHSYMIDSVTWAKFFSLLYLTSWPWVRMLMIQFKKMIASLHFQQGKHCGQLALPALLPNFLSYMKKSWTGAKRRFIVLQIPFLTNITLSGNSFEVKWTLFTCGWFYLGVCLWGGSMNWIIKWRIADWK